MAALERMRAGGHAMAAFERMRAGGHERIRELARHLNRCKLGPKVIVENKVKAP